MINLDDLILEKEWEPLRNSTGEVVAVIIYGRENEPTVIMTIKEWLNANQAEVLTSTEENKG